MINQQIHYQSKKTAQVFALVSDLSGIKVPFLYINHLIQNKKAVTRPKDQVDVIYLEKIKKILEEEAQKNQSL